MKEVIEGLEDFLEVNVLDVMVNRINGKKVLFLFNEEKMLLIYVDSFTAMNIKVLLNLDYQAEINRRSLTYDMMKNITEKIGGEIMYVKINSMDNDVYLSSILLKQKDKMIEIDARPSDAIALALKTNKKIYVNKKIMEEYGIKKEFGYRKGDLNFC